MKWDLLRQMDAPSQAFVIEIFKRLDGIEAKVDALLSGAIELENEYGNGRAAEKLESDPAGAGTPPA